MLFNDISLASCAIKHIKMRIKQTTILILRNYLKQLIISFPDNRNKKSLKSKSFFLETIQSNFRNKKLKTF